MAYVDSDNIIMALWFIVVIEIFLLSLWQYSNLSYKNTDDLTFKFNNMKTLGKTLQAQEQLKTKSSETWEGVG